MLKVLTFRKDEEWRIRSEDIERLKAVLEENGFTAAENDIFLAWSRHSEGMSAVWLGLPQDDDVLLAIMLREFEHDPEADNSIPSSFL